MDNNKILIGAVILVVICLAVGGILLFSQDSTSDSNNANATNMTNITHLDNKTNSTGSNLTNATVLKGSEGSESQSASSSGSESDPEVGSDDYVKRWDESQRNNDDWAYVHDQPVKSEDGHDYKRVYDEESGDSYWYQMDQNSDDSGNDDSSDSQNDDSGQD